MKQFQAKVLSIKPYGAILALADGVRGLLPTRLASPTRINSCDEVMSVDDVLTVYILGVDERGVSFSFRPITGGEKQDGPAGKKKGRGDSGSAAREIRAIQEKLDPSIAEERKRREATARAGASLAPPPGTDFKEDYGMDVGAYTEPELDDEVEVEERKYKGVTYLVDPTTNELYTEEGEVVGEWEGEEPVFY